jgi:2-polyprenyl-3-methyl-5-hydroxy-6-metoxy-1,4-benzoquinol methylase
MVESKDKLVTEQVCPLCTSPFPQIFLEKKGVPVHQNMLCANAEEARQFARGDLRLAFCKTCGFVFNAAFDPNRLRYSSVYDNTQSCSPYFKHYLVELAESLIKKYDLRDKMVIEVGCGKGEFLQLLCKEGRNRGIGFDPSYVGPDTAERGAVRFIRAFYDFHQNQHAPDFVCCRHVIEHVQSPMDMLRAIRLALGDRMNSHVFFETPTLSWILDTVTFWDFFYEHCSYFTPQSLTWAFQKAGFDVLESHSIFDGQYISLEAKPASDSKTPESATPCSVHALSSKIQSFQARLKERMESCEAKINSFNRAGGCVIWGAAAKGTTLVNAIDPGNDRIRFLIDINPAKQGKFVAGTGHRIVPPGHLREQVGNIAGIINMNPNYLEENRAILAQLSLQIPIISL